MLRAEDGLVGQADRAGEREHEQERHDGHLVVSPALGVFVPLCGLAAAVALAAGFGVRGACIAPPTATSWTTHKQLDRLRVFRRVVLARELLGLVWEPEGGPRWDGIAVRRRKNERVVHRWWTVRELAEVGSFGLEDRVRHLSVAGEGNTRKVGDAHVRGATPEVAWPRQTR